MGRHVPMSRTLEDGPPRTVPPVKLELGATRYELPLMVAGVKGLLLIRCFDDKDEVELSIRGYAAALLERLP